MAASSEAKGLEFFQRRLERAQAVPPAERSPEVAAFVDSVALLQAADALLPLTRDGAPALPFGEASWRQEALAMAYYVSAEHICPYSPMWPGITEDRVGRYLDRATRRPGAGSSMEGYPLLPLLQRYNMAVRARDERLAVIEYAKIAELLDAPRNEAAAAMQLAELQRPGAVEGASASAAGLPRLTVPQLQLRCLCHAAGFASILLGENLPRLLGSGGGGGASGSAGSAPQLSRAQLEQLAQLACNSSEALLRLAPDCPRDCMVAAQALPSASMLLHGGAMMTTLQRTVGLLVHATRQARAQGRAYDEALACSRALGAVASSPVPIDLSQADLEVLVQGYERAPEALRRLKKVLPQAWIAILEGTLKDIPPHAESVRARLRAASAGGNARAAAEAQAAASAALRPLPGSASTGGKDEDQVVCSGCQEQSLGLRRCSRCRATAYCSAACQKAHWKVHKPDCKPVA